MKTSTEIEKELEVEYTKYCEKAVAILVSERKGLQEELNVLHDRIGKVTDKIIKFDTKNPEFRLKFFNKNYADCKESRAVESWLNSL